ncbi:hypothetical protein U1Q18_027940 [Sarracenia purpurea var. burkii]
MAAGVLYQNLQTNYDVSVVDIIKSPFKNTETLTSQEYRNPNFASRSLMKIEALVQSSSLNIPSGFEILQENCMWGSTGLDPSERARREVIAQLQQQQKPDQEEKGCDGEEIRKVNYEYSIML